MEIGKWTDRRPKVLVATKNIESRVAIVGIIGMGDLSKAKISNLYQTISSYFLPLFLRYLSHFGCRVQTEAYGTLGT